ncbi:MAG TPA: 23S rRNA (adenine(2503)-C(2))-methyltransferase RlmN, partial [Paludibacteraceae bacterium]|nr:23S rRNA (adenine(2503)-C(2))-methyltransferase RlmN [Paludibacteraceae bacterium]
MQNTVLLGKNLNELKDVAKTLGMPTFTGKQLAEWLYKKRAVSFD